LAVAFRLSLASSHIYYQNNKIQPTHLPNNLMTHGSALLGFFLSAAPASSGPTTVHNKQHHPTSQIFGILANPDLHTNFRGSEFTVFVDSHDFSGCFTINDKRQTTTINDKRQANINTQLGNHPAQNLNS